MGCAFGTNRENQHQSEQVETALAKIEESLERVKARHNHLFTQLKSKGATRREQKIILVYIKQTIGLKTTLQNVGLAIEQGAISSDVVKTLKYSRDALRNLTKQQKTEDIYKLVDELSCLSEAIEENGQALAELDISEFDDDVLEQELQQLYITQDSGIPEPILPSVPSQSLSDAGASTCCNSNVAAPLLTHAS